MASIKIVDMTDDLDPRITSDVETVTIVHPAFGTKHEIELGAQNRKHLLAHLAKLDKYFAAARLVEEPAPTVVNSAPKAKVTGEKALIRAWAKANGYEVGDRGRIKAEIIDAYYAAHNEDAPVSDAVTEEPTPVVETDQPVTEDSDTEPTDAEIMEIENGNDRVSRDQVTDMIEELFSSELSETDQPTPVVETAKPKDAPNEAERKKFGY